VTLARKSSTSFSLPTPLTDAPLESEEARVGEGSVTKRAGSR
jgi:hypothetical protein